MQKEQEKEAREKFPKKTIVIYQASHKNYNIAVVVGDHMRKRLSAPISDEEIKKSEIVLVLGQYSEASDPKGKWISTIFDQRRDFPNYQAIPATESYRTQIDLSDRIEELKKQRKNTEQPENDGSGKIRRFFSFPPKQASVLSLVFLVGFFPIPEKYVPGWIELTSDSIRRFYKELEDGFKEEKKSKN